MSLFCQVTLFLTFKISVLLCPTTVSTLEGNIVLTKLTMACCNIDGEGTTCLAQALCGITKLEELDLSGNAIGQLGAEHLGKLNGIVRVCTYNITGCCGI